MQFMISIKYRHITSLPCIVRKHTKHVSCTVEDPIVFAINSMAEKKIQKKIDRKP